MKKLTLEAVEKLINAQTKALKEEIEKLRAEVVSLRSSLNTPALYSQSVATPSQQSHVAKVVQESVQSAFRKESAMKDIVINLPEKKNDAADIDAICEKASVCVKPSSISRMGKPRSDRPRPLKVSFQTVFDARAFMSRIDACRKNSDDTDGMSKLKCRPCRSHEEQKRFLKLIKEVRSLNDGAKDGESYSLRQDCEIWKFAKNESGHWVRVPDWVRSHAESENDQSTSTHEEASLLDKSSESDTSGNEVSTPTS